MARSPLASGNYAPLRLTFDVWTQIQETIGRSAPEQGGMLGGYPGEDTVRFFHFDQTAQRSYGSYSPDHRSLNSLLKNEWNPKGVRLLGFVHSHPRAVSQPSYGDLLYAQAILAAIPELPRLLLPIVITDPERHVFFLHAYAAVRGHGPLHEDPFLQISSREDSVRIVPLVTKVLRDSESRPHEAVEMAAEAVSSEPATVEEVPRPARRQPPRSTDEHAPKQRGARNRGRTGHLEQTRKRGRQVRGGQPRNRHSHRGKRDSRTRRDS